MPEIASPWAFAPARTRPENPARPAHSLLELSRQPDGSFVSFLPAGLRGRWCRIAMRLPERGGLCVVAFGMDGAEESVGPEIILGDGVTRATPRSAVTFLPSETRSLRLRLFGPGAQGGQPIISITTVSYAAAALSVCLRQPWQAGRAVIRAALRGGPPKMLGQLRRDVGCMAARSGGTGCYTVWSQSFDLWPLAAIERLMRSSRRAAWPSIAAFVFHTSGSSEAALRASLAALDHGPISVPRQIVGSGVALTGAVADSSAEYVALLQAGEILPAHALPLLADHAVALGRPDILYADEDAITADDRRHSPIFKPQPSRLLMLSGTLSRGVWLVRRGLLVGASPGAGAWAETARLDAWLRLHESGRGEHSHRIPHVLTHRRADTDAAPADALAGIARQHVARTGFPVQINPGDPLRLRVTVPRERQPKVSIIVPSACRGAHVAACLDTVLARTDYADYEIILTVAGRLPLDDQQNRILSRLAGDGRVHPLVLRMDRFNYAAANNAAAREASGDFICLLNDDVAPLHDGWLATLVGHLADPQIGVVGAKLLYPDRTIQHAGIVLCPEGVGEHAHRFLGRGDRGYASRAILSQQVSAVTGACLLTRRNLYDRLGGMDESFASAFNDVDFCLRAGAAGFGVVLAADAELIHHESLSYGRHYAAGEDVRAAQDRARMRARWGALCDEDPFHSPNLGRHASGQSGGRWQLAFPPRTAPLESVPTAAEAA